MSNPGDDIHLYLKEELLSRVALINGRRHFTKINNDLAYLHLHCQLIRLSSVKHIGERCTWTNSDGQTNDRTSCVVNVKALLSGLHFGIAIVVRLVESSFHFKSFSQFFH